MDLNICIECAGVRDSDNVIREKLDKCFQLGFHTVALSVNIDVSNYKSKGKGSKAKSGETDDIHIPPAPDKKSLNLTNKLKVYTRLTVRVGHTEPLYKLSKNPVTSTYDLLALEPQNYEILQYIARGNTNLDILTFDLSDRMDFNIFKTKFKILEDKNVCMEINYGATQMGSSMRRNIICNGQNLIEKTIKNVILSNGVQDTFRLRGPMDAMSLGVLFMIPQKRCHDTVYKNGAKALESAKHRANPISSAIELIKSDNQ